MPALKSVRCYANDEKCWILCQRWKVLDVMPTMKTFHWKVLNIMPALKSVRCYANDEKCWILCRRTSAEHPPLSVSVSGTLGISINLLLKHCSKLFGINWNCLIDCLRERDMIWVFGRRICRKNIVRWVDKKIGGHSQRTLKESMLFQLWLSSPWNRS